MPTPRPQSLDSLGPKLRDGTQLMTSGPVDHRTGKAVVPAAPTKKPFRSVANDDPLDIRVDSVINLEAGNGGAAMARIGAQLVEDIINKRDVTLLDRYIREANSSSRVQRDAACTVLHWFVKNLAQAFKSYKLAWVSSDEITYWSSMGIGGLGPLLGAGIRGLKTLLPQLPDGHRIKLDAPAPKKTVITRRA